MTGGRQVKELNGDGTIDVGGPNQSGWRPYFDVDNNGRFDRGNAATFTNTTVVPIPDNLPAGITSTVAVAALAGTITDVEVSVNITHTYTGDLTIFLTSPGGITVQLFNRDGLSGDNLTDTVFDTTSLTPIRDGFAPFAGRFRPTDSLSTFNGLAGLAVNGTWTLRVVDNAGADIGTLNSWSMTIATMPTFSSATAVPIPDYVSDPPSYTTFTGPSSAYSTLAVSGISGPINHIRARLNITHSYDGDLTVFLVSPGGVPPQLLNRNGGSGANFASTVFDDFSDTAIGSGAAPFTGTFRPAQPLGYFTGLSGSQVNGTWTLELHDNAGADTGTLNSWSLSFEAGEPFAITDSNGSYAFYNFAGNYSLTEEHQPGWHPTLPTLGSYYVPNFASGTSYGGAPFLVTADSSIPTATIAVGRADADQCRQRAIHGRFQRVGFPRNWQRRLRQARQRRTSQ